MKVLENSFKLGLVIAGVLIVILIATLAILLTSNRLLATPTVVDENTTTPVLRNTKTSLATSTYTPTPPDTNTPEPKDAAVNAQSTSPIISPTAPNIIQLDWCLTSDEAICIGSISLNYDTLAIVVQKPNNQDDVYIILDGTRYDDCVPIGGYNDRYFCVNLPALINRTVFIQIFMEGLETPLAEGNIYLDEALIGSLQPTETTQPPDPYRP